MIKSELFKWFSKLRVSNIEFNKLVDWCFCNIAVHEYVKCTGNVHNIYT